MRIQKKLVKTSALLCVSGLILVLMPVSATADKEKDGKLQLKMDRIINSQDEQMDLRETELERTFPTLFTVETNQAIKEKKMENKSTIKELEQTIFSLDIDKTSTVQNVKDHLFSEEYAITASNENQVKEEPSSGGGFSKIMIGLFVGIGTLLFSGLYLAKQFLLD